MEFLLKDFVGKPSIVEKRKQISYVLHSMKSISCCLCYCVADRSLLTLGFLEASLAKVRSTDLMLFLARCGDRPKIF